MKILISSLAFALAIAPAVAARAQLADNPPAPAPSPPPAPPPAAAPPLPAPVAPAPAPAPPGSGAENLLPPPVTPWGQPAPPSTELPPGLLPPAYLPPADVPPESPSQRTAGEFAQLRRGFHPGVSLGFVALPDNALVGASASFIANFGVHRNVDLRAGLRLAAGAGFNGWGPDGVVEVPLSVRFNFGTVYSMGIGFDMGALLLSASDCTLTINNVSASCGSSVTPYFLFGPDLTFVSFRAGPKREVEIEWSGGPSFIVPQSGLVFYPRVAVSVAYLML